MDVNSINSSITSLNNVPNQQVSRSNQSTQVENNDASIQLSINEYNQKRDELSASLQTYNDGIGLSRTAVNGLENQEKILNSLKNDLTEISENTSDSIDNNSIKNDLNTKLLNFREEAYITRYKNESLLSVDEYEKNEIINISTKETYLSVDRPNTPEISSQIGQEISKSDLNNSQDLEKVLETVKEGISQLETYQAQFTNLENELEINARSSIAEQVELSTQNRVNNTIDFPREMTDFSKSNINANAGYLAASQANIVQEQTVRLLS